MAPLSFRRCLYALLLLPSLGARADLQSRSVDAQLLEAAGKGDVAAATALLNKGANVNFADNQGLTPLFVASDRANVELVKLLLARGADPNKTQELMWGRTALAVASVGTSGIQNDAARNEIVHLLAEKGAGRDGESLGDLIRGRHLDVVKAILAGGTAKPTYLNTALASAKRANQPEVVQLLVGAGAKDPGPLDSPRSAERLRLMTGVYRNAAGQELKLTIGLSGDQLLLDRSGNAKVMLFPVELTRLKSEDRAVVIATEAGALPPLELTLITSGTSMTFKRMGDVAAPAAMTRSTASPSPATADSRPARGGSIPPTQTSKDWPSFRGPFASGVADSSAKPPTTWDLEKSVNIKWKTPIPGFAHSSPVVWGDRIFVTTAVPTGGDALQFKHGDSAGVASTTDSARHSWRVYALDRQSGKILWDRVAYEGVPKTQRHVMASQANSTPATDGKHLVAFFGSEGLYCYDLDGKLVWRRDLGPLKANRVLDASYEWNTATSPIIYKNLVILQLDLMEDSRISAFDVNTGKDVWRTTRDEIPAWATPLVYDDGRRVQIVTAAGKFARGYDPETGKELWKLGKHSEFPTPSPIAGAGLIFVTSGTGSTVQPIYAIKPGAAGDITLKDDEESSGSVAWSKLRGGPSIPTPIFYGDLLYVSSNNGILAAYRPETGERVYQERLTRGGSYSASGVAAAGKLYFPSEDGDVIVVKAGPTFEKLAQNPMGELMMATPAIVGNMIILRTQSQIVAVAESSSAPTNPAR